MERRGREKEKGREIKVRRERRKQERNEGESKGETEGRKEGERRSRQQWRERERGGKEAPMLPPSGTNALVPFSGVKNLC